MIQHAGQARVGKMQNRKVAKESKSSPQSRLANVDAKLSDRRSEGHVLQILQRDRRREGGRERERLMDAQLGPWNYALYRQVWFPFRELRP